MSDSPCGTRYGRVRLTRSHRLDTSVDLVPPCCDRCDYELRKTPGCEVMAIPGRGAEPGATAVSETLGHLDGIRCLVRNQPQPLDSHPAEPASVHPLVLLLGAAVRRHSARTG